MSEILKLVNKKPLFIVIATAALGILCANLFLTDKSEQGKPEPVVKTEVHLPAKNSISDDVQSVIGDQIPSTSSQDVSGDAQEPLYEEIIRAEFERTSDLPVGVSFKVTLGLLEDLNEEDPDYALYHLRHEMGFDQADDDDKSRELLEELLVIRKTITAEVREENRRLGCLSGIPVAAGEEIYPILEAMDDTEEIVANRYLSSLKRKLDTDTAERLDRWLEDQKTNITQVKYNQRGLYEWSGESVDAKLASICNKYSEEE